MDGEHTTIADPMRCRCLCSNQFNPFHFDNQLRSIQHYPVVESGVIPLYIIDSLFGLSIWNNLHGDRDLGPQHHVDVRMVVPVQAPIRLFCLGIVV